MREVNKTIFEAYILANVHVVRCCQEGIKVPELGQNFFYNCLASVSVCGRAKTEAKNIYFRKSVELYRSWRPPDYVPPDSRLLASGWHNNASLQMATNTRTYISTTFYSRFRKFLSRKFNIRGDELKF